MLDSALLDCYSIEEMSRCSSYNPPDMVHHTGPRNPDNYIPIQPLELYEVNLS